MSRHRNIRQFVADEYSDAVNGGDDDDDQYYQSRSSQDIRESHPAGDNTAHLEALRSATARISDMLGGEFDVHEIEETLEYYELNEEYTLRWLLEGVDSYEPGSQSKDAQRAASTTSRTSISENGGVPVSTLAKSLTSARDHALRAYTFVEFVAQSLRTTSSTNIIRPHCCFDYPRCIPLCESPAPGLLYPMTRFFAPTLRKKTTFAPEFDFSTPSPDDIVRDARRNAFSNSGGLRSAIQHTPPTAQIRHNASGIIHFPLRPSNQISATTTKITTTTKPSSAGSKKNDSVTNSETPISNSNTIVLPKLSSSFTTATVINQPGSQIETKNKNPELHSQPETTRKRKNSLSKSRDVINLPSKPISTQSNGKINVLGTIPPVATKQEKVQPKTQNVSNPIAAPTNKTAQSTLQKKNNKTTPEQKQRENDKNKTSKQENTKKQEEQPQQKQSQKKIIPEKQKEPQRPTTAQTKSAKGKSSSRNTLGSNDSEIFVSDILTKSEDQVTEDLRAMNISELASANVTTSQEFTASSLASLQCSAGGSSKKKLVSADTRTRILQAEMQKRKPHLSFVVAGHVDAGKSTILGHLLFLAGCVDPRVMHKFERESEMQNKGSFSYAWVLDSKPEERERGITMDVASTSFEAKTEHGVRRFTVLDTPGHRDFVPNMISGASMADAAVLVVDARPGEFERGHTGGGQTREHLLILKVHGCENLVVAVNKMDAKTVNWSRNRFNEIQETLWEFLKTLKYSKDNVTFVPCSGLTGKNLCSTSVAGSNEEDENWYTGPTLLDALAKITTPARPVIKAPLRMVITDVIGNTNINSSGGGNSSSQSNLSVNSLGSNAMSTSGVATVVVCGQIVTGSLIAGEQVTLAPEFQKCDVRGIASMLTDENTCDHGSAGSLGMGSSWQSLASTGYESAVACAVAGDHVAVTLRGVETSYLKQSGMVLCDSTAQPGASSVFVSDRIEAEVTVFESKVPITLGFLLSYHCGAVVQPAYVMQIMVPSASKASSEGQLAMKPMRYIPAKTKARFQLRLERPVCVTTAALCEHLSRFVLRHDGATIAFGKVTRVYAPSGRKTGRSKNNDSAKGSAAK